MRRAEFERILGVFADPGTETLTDGSDFLIEINGNTISGSLKTQAGEILIRELDAGDFIPASVWIIKRLANLDLLANRLIDGLHQCKDFVSPELKVSKSLDYELNELEHVENNSIDKIIDLLEDGNAFSTDVFYLVSDAGEGKTTVINEVARRQALRFKQGEAHRLVVPVSLGGRTFLRFDDITVGVLQNRYRFPYLHYSAFIELIRMGMIVPAFDGFEEMFVETSTGEANSALGNLLNSLASEGNMLIATRKAYFDFHDVKSQEKLFDSIKGFGVEFRKIEIERWSKKHFLDYCDKCCVDDAEKLYETIAKKIGHSHSLLTRPVLIKQLIEVVLETPTIDVLLEQIYASNDSFFSTFVKAIVEREAKEKWLDRSGEVGAPLLTIQEHCNLLSEVAIEMWTSKLSYIKKEVLEFVVEYYCEETHKSPNHTDQIKKRINNHALLTTSENSANSLEFDHDEFFQYFLGEAIADRLVKAEKNSVEILSIFQKGILSDQAKSICSLAIKRTNQEQSVIEKLIEIISLDSRASFSHSNATYILYSILNKLENPQPVILENMSFSADLSEASEISNISFKNCYFEKLSLLNSKVHGCNFEDVRIARLEVSNRSKINKSTLNDKSVIDSIFLEKQSVTVYEPDTIKRISDGYFTVSENEMIDSTVYNFSEDSEIKLLKKILIYFLRSTHIGENIMRMKLGTQNQTFINDVLPDLIGNNVFQEIPNISSNKDRRFKLGRRLEKIHNCIDESKGSYKVLLNLFGKL